MNTLVNTSATKEYKNAVIKICKKAKGKAVPVTGHGGP
jgi:hypothetical protein